MGQKDYYRILQVHPEASEEVIKKAYQTLALRYHPDKHKPARRKWAEEKFKELSEAYRVLSDPIKRRDYDRSGYPEKLAKETTTASGRADEEAYFYYRMGMGHYKRAQKKAPWRILSGRVESDLKKAKDDFMTVLDDYPNSKYTEDAHFYYICTLMESYEYDNESLKEAEEEFNEFLDEFPRGRWAAEVKVRRARFYLFKKRDYAGAIDRLTDLVNSHPEGDLAEEAKVLLSYAKEVKKRSTSKKGKKSG